MSKKANHEKAVTITGYIEEAEEEGHVRVFTTADADVFFEIPQSAVLNRETIEDGGLDVGSTKIQIDAESNLIAKRVTTREFQASLLGGSLESTTLEGFAGEFTNPWLGGNFAVKTGTARCGPSKDPCSHICPKSFSCPKSHSCP